MKKRWIFLPAVAAAIVVATAVWPEPSPPDPVFEGKPLSRWLYDYETYMFISSGTFLHHDEAVRSIGTNAIPMLLRKLETRDSPLKDRLATWGQRLRLVRSDKPVVSAGQQNRAGWHGFKALGAVAAPAVPALIRIYERKISDSSMCAAASSLGYIGPSAVAAIPALLRHATNGSLAVRPETIRALGLIHCEADIVIPALMRIIDDPKGEDQARSEAIWSLGMFGVDANRAVPCLVRAVQTNFSRNCRSSAVEALSRIHPEPGIAVGVFRAALSDLDYQLRWEAIHALGGYGTNASSAIRELKMALTDSDSTIRYQAARALSQIDPEFTFRDD